MEKERANYIVERTRELRFSTPLPTFEKISEILFSEGYCQDNGSKFHDAFLSAQLIKRYPEMRTKREFKKKKKETKKNDSKKGERERAINLFLKDDNFSIETRLELANDLMKSKRSNRNGEIEIQIGDDGKGETR